VIGGVHQNPDDEKISSEIFAVPKVHQDLRGDSSELYRSARPGKGYDLVEELLCNSSPPHGLTTARNSKVG
jgi:hypothetical protein